MKKCIFAKLQASPISVTLYIYDHIKFLIDDNHILYHYTDRVPLGKMVDGIPQWFYDTQEQYDAARFHNKVVIKRFLDS